MRKQRFMCQTTKTQFLFLVASAFMQAIAILGFDNRSLSAQEIVETELATRFERQVHAIIAQHCTECHSEKTAEADIDITLFKSLSDVKQQLPVWQKVAEMLSSRQMPPKDAKQLSESDSQLLRLWVGSMLQMEARRSAGDPGPVVLRRLNNAEYTYTIRDLTGLRALTPAQEFPADGAAGEGFTNAGNALSMSPALFAKYLDAAKAVAAHAVLLPSGIRFSEFTTRRDWTEELLTNIRQLYATYSAKTGETQVNLQGVVFDTNSGGRLPVEQYMRATLEEREALTKGTKSIESVANERELSSKYLKLIWGILQSQESTTQLLTDLRTKWRQAGPQQAAELTAQISGWQQSLWGFSSVGHIGKVNGPKAWMEPLNPLVSRQELRFKLPAAGPDNLVSIYLVTGDAGDGNERDLAVWERPRLVAAGRPDLLLRDVRRVTSELAKHREETFQVAAQCLAAAAETYELEAPFNLSELAAKYQVPAIALQAWLDYLGVAAQGPIKIASPLGRPMASAAGYDFIRGWVGDDALSVVANSSDNAVRIPGNMRPHSVAVHPSPTLQVAVGWRSPVADSLRIAGSVQHAHPECGNGVGWALELRRGNSRQRLATGVSQGAAVVSFGPFESVSVQPGDLISLVINPRDGNHSCDLTAIELSLASATQSWNLAQDVSPDILAANPHADRLGNKEVWHFYSEPVSQNNDHVIPTGSLLARWQATGNKDERKQLGEALQKLLLDGTSGLAADAPDKALHQQLTSLSGPLLSAALQSIAAQPTNIEVVTSELGLDPKIFGVHPDGDAVEPGSLCVKAPSIIEVRLPADLVAGSEFVATGYIHPSAANAGSVQFEVLTEKPATLEGLQAIAVTEGVKSGAWTSNNRSVSMTAPIVVAEDSPVRRQLITAFDDFRNLFPTALCYTKIVPVDEVVTLTLYYREDDQLKRLMLNDAEIANLDRLWKELHFASQDAFLSVDAYEQLWQFATQDADPSAFEPLREPLKQRAEEFRNELSAAEPTHVAAVVRFAEQAFRRPLSRTEKESLEGLYTELRTDELTHEDSVRLLLARVLVAPAFLYRTEVGGANTATTSTPATRRVTDFELAVRLSYFLWSSAPDERLRSLASERRLHEPEVLREETQRLLKDERAATGNRIRLSVVADLRIRFA